MYQRTIPVLMTPEQAHAKAMANGLSPQLADWIMAQFEEQHQAMRQFRRDNGDDFEEEEIAAKFVGDDGRAAYGQSWEYMAEELAQAMGKKPEAGLYGEDPEFERVWDLFFQE